MSNPKIWLAQFVLLVIVSVLGCGKAGVEGAPKITQEQYQQQPPGEPGAAQIDQPRTGVGGMTPEQMQSQGYPQPGEVSSGQQDSSGTR